ncbi:MAG: hypothetical protein P8K77_06490 [Polaribacter sp.]|nr:hypothetical protein [Polaribacter sp.]
MKLRVIFLLLLGAFTTSCQFFNLDRTSIQQEVDTIVDFSVVDVSPSFAICDSVIDKVAKTACFRNTIHQQVSKSLRATPIIIKGSIDETIFVHVLIDKEGKVTLKNIESSAELKEALVHLDSLVRISLQRLPTLFPAIKRGIPVSTQYQLPIKIQVQ